MTGSRRQFVPSQPDLLCGTQHPARLCAHPMKRGCCSERTASSKEPVLRGEQGKGWVRIHGTERWMDTPQCLGTETQSPSWYLQQRFILCVKASCSSVFQPGGEAFDSGSRALGRLPAPLPLVHRCCTCVSSPPAHIPFFQSIGQLESSLFLLGRCGFLAVLHVVLAHIIHLLHLPHQHLGHKQDNVLGGGETPSGTNSKAESCSTQPTRSHLLSGTFLRCPQPREGQGRSLRDGQSPGMWLMTCSSGRQHSCSDP